MPAARPRMQVTPTERSYLLLRELSSITGKAPATIVREILDEAVPALETSLKAFRTINERPQESQAAVMRMIGDAQTTLAQASLNLTTDRKPGRKPGNKSGSDGTR